MELYPFYPTSCCKSAVVIPCFREEKRININKYLADADKFSSQIFLVDDGSPDKTFDMLKKLEKANPDKFIAVKSPQNQGKGEAVRLGMNVALDNKFKRIGFLDADLAVDFAEYDRLLKSFDYDKEINTVIGVRANLAGHKIDRTKGKYLAQKIIAKMGSVLFAPEVTDTQCGAKAFSSDVLEKTVKEPFIARWLFDQELLTRISRLKENAGKNWLFEYPVRKWTEYGNSHVSWKDYGKCVSEYFSLVFKYGIRK